MTNNKPEKNVAGMAVLKDIRSLLSSTGETKNTSPVAAKPEKAVPRDKDKTTKELKQCQETIKQHQTQINRLEAEKKELSEKLAILQSSIAKPPEERDSLVAGIADMEVRQEELSRALTQIEGLLQIKLKDLVRRISRVYEEAGDFEAGRDFRRISNQLEAAENFGEFIRALVRE